MTTKYMFLLTVILLPMLCSCIKVKAVLRKCEQSKTCKTFISVPGLNGCENKVEVDVGLNVDQSNTEVKYIKVDKVFDEVLEEEVRLFHPLIIKIQSKTPALVYPLKFLKSVNNKAYEIFFHKDNTRNYQGCKESSVQSMCGYGDIKSDESKQTYKQGFCCGCSKDDQNSQPYHIRSGQDCSHTEIPMGLDESYHSSAHCLKFDPVWYRVNELEEPYISHYILVSVFTEKTDDFEEAKWTTLSDNSQELVVGSLNNYAITEDGKVSVSYKDSGDKKGFTEFDPLGHKQNRLLVPETDPYEDYSNHMPLQLKGNASDFLLVDYRFIKLDGNVCDRIGVSYEAFFKQDNKCFKPAQSCLDNQPMHFWLQDVGSKLQGKHTNFFLGSFSDVAVPPLYKTKSSKWNLCLKYKKKITARAYIQINADTLIPLIKGIGCDIEEIYYTGNSETEKLSVHVFNPGLIQEDYLVIVNSCNISQYGEHRKSETVGPHQSKKVVFKLKTEHSIYPKLCTVSVLNHRSQKVAERIVWFKQGQQCICLLNCQCSCEVDNFICVPLNKHTGFQAGIQRVLFEGLFIGPEDPVFILVTILTILCYIGMIKSTMSIFSPVKIGQFGLCLFMKTTTLSGYYEKELKNFKVVYDDEGVPIHPKTKKHVQTLPTWQILVLNSIIGFYLPFIGFHWCILKMCKTIKKVQLEKEETIWEKKLNLTEFEKNVSSISCTELKNFRLSPSSLAKVDRDLAIEQYRRQKKGLLKQMKLDSASRTSLATCDITPPDSDDEHETTPKRVTRSSSAGRKLNICTFAKQTIQGLLQMDQVYCNFEKESKYLKNSGTYFSLRGVLRRDGKKFRFELGNYFMQTYEHIDGIARPLPHPERILHSLQFCQLMTPMAVHTVISTEPQYPCLNAPLPF